MTGVNRFFKIIFLVCVWLCFTFGETNLIAAISRLDLYLDKQFNERNDNKIAPIVFSLDNTLVAFATSNKTIRLWNLKRRCLICEFFGHYENINSIAFSPNGKLLVSGSSDKTVRLWNVKSGSCVHVFYGHNSEVCSVEFNPMGSQIVSMSFDGMVMIFDAFTHKRLRVFYWPL
ncbi:MAG: hypothetical protein WCS92_04975 [Candidatus Babeliales bacterium]|jgi:WD40 repeat protein|nr:MAG: hypothetical protein US22_C0050G0002 [candidate division TM6 bacterium GW2011_GWF2_36_6]